MAYGCRYKLGGNEEYQDEDGRDSSDRTCHGSRAKELTMESHGHGDPLTLSLRMVSSLSTTVSFRTIT